MLKIINMIFLSSYTVELPADVLSIVDNMNKANAQSNIKPMWKKTRDLLDEFFRPYNGMLARLLGDERFLWNRD